MRKMMIVAAAIGLSATGATAECIGHKTTSASVDTEVTTASIAKSGQPASEKQITMPPEEAVTTSE